MKKKLIISTLAVLMIGLVIVGIILDPPTLKSVHKSDIENQYVIVLKDGEVLVEYVPESWSEKAFYRFVESDKYNIEGYSFDENGKGEKLAAGKYKITINGKTCVVKGIDILRKIKEA